MTPAQFGAFGWLWKILHAPDAIVVGSTAIFTNYVLVPWIFVMSAGYCFGRVFDLEPAARVRLLIRIGAAAILAFVVLRASNLDRDPSSWSPPTSLADPELPVT